MSPYEKYTKDLLNEVASRSRSINDMLRHLGLPLHGGTHAHISQRLRQLEVDTLHFTHLHGRRERKTYTKEALAAAAARASTTRDMLDILGVAPYDSAYTYIRRRCQHFGIDISHLRRSRHVSRLDAEDVRRAASQAASVSELLRLLGLPASGAARAQVKKAIEEHNIDTGHFTGQVHNRGQASPHRLRPDELLRHTPDAIRRTQPHKLRRALAEIGRAYACAGCGIPGIWQGLPLVLEIDHVNGDWRDNREANLRFLCPNCHSQTDTYRGRNKSAVRPNGDEPLPLPRPRR